jgi:hypothetical protein
MEPEHLTHAPTSPRYSSRGHGGRSSSGRCNSCWEDEEQYEDDVTTHLHELITQAEYIHLCDEVIRLQIWIADHHREYEED